MSTTFRLLLFPLLVLLLLLRPDPAAPSSQTCPAVHTCDPAGCADPNNSLYAPPDSAAAVAAVDADSVDAVVDSDDAVDTAAAT